jgi:nucleotide-binding universal stress UspA family protein
VARDTAHVVHEHPYGAIIDTAKRRGCDLICMASHGRRGASALLLGSETTKVVPTARSHTLVCR